jgi:hypothetical protein
VYYILLVVGILVSIASLALAAMIVRKTRPVGMVITAIAASVFLCGGVIGYFVVLGQYC